MNFFRKLCALLLSFNIVVMQPLMAMEIVYVPGPNCSNVYSDYCGWGGWDTYSGGGGGYTTIELGGGGGGPSTAPSGPGISDDGTTGTTNLFNRFNPGCPREAQFMNEVEAGAVSGDPPGVVIMTSFKDSLYDNGDWVKIQHDRIYREINSANPSTGMRWRTTVHYMYNTWTNEVQQLKLKTSFELGCKGIPYSS